MERTAPRTVLIRAAAFGVLLGLGTLATMLALTATQPGCAVLTTQPTTQPVNPNQSPVAYLQGQVTHWRDVVAALRKQLDMPGTPAQLANLREQLDQAEWWLNWFTLALSAAEVRAREHAAAPARADSAQGVNFPR